MVELYFCNLPLELSEIIFFCTGFIAHVNEYHKIEFQCLDGSVPKFLGGGYDKVVAVLAAQSSSVTLQVNTETQLSCIYISINELWSANIVPYHGN